MARVRQLVKPKKAPFAYELRFGVVPGDCVDLMSLMVWLNEVYGVPEENRYFMRQKNDGYAFQITIYFQEESDAALFKLRCI